MIVVLVIAFLASGAIAGWLLRGWWDSLAAEDWWDPELAAEEGQELISKKACGAVCVSFKDRHFAVNP